MKKTNLILAFIGMITLNNCTTEQVIEKDIKDNDTISEVFELQNVNFSNTNTVNFYEIYRKLTPAIFNSDQILIYRKTGIVNSSTIWQLIPRTINFNNGGVIYYDFDFSREDFRITATANYNLIGTTPEYIFNQTFRIVIIPGSFSGRFDFSNYNLAMEFYGLKESDVKIIN
jgi:hypothetical protein